MFTNAFISFALRAGLMLVLAVGMLGIQPTRSVSAATVVTNISDSGPGSLRQAIASAPPGDTITFSPSLAGQTIILSSSLILDKNLTINGASLPSKLSISGNNSVTVLIVNPGIVATLDSLTIKNGRSYGFGGGVYNGGSLTVRNSLFSENHLFGADAYSGGAIASRGGTLVVTGSTFSANSAISNPYLVGNGEGGAIYSQGTLTVRNSTFTGNSASRGGAISCTQGAMTLTDSTYSSNRALSASGGDGGAIFNNNLCNATIENSTFSGNTAAHYGGAVFTDDGLGQSKVINSTLYGNAAQAGGGIANYGGLIVTNSTLSGNNAPSGGAIRNGIGGSLSIRNSILANSVGGVDCSKSDAAPAIQNINNLIETTGTNATSCGTSLLTSDPLLGPLQNNGGSTRTMALGAGSPAIDAGNDAYCPATDQRAVSRPQGSHCDIGAYEAKGAVVVSIAGTEFGPYELDSGESKRVNYGSVNDGPVKIAHQGNTALIAAERVIYTVNNVNTSFTEMMGLPNKQLDKIYWLPWYNNLGLDSQLRLANVSDTPATVHITIAGQPMTGTGINIPAGESTRVSFEGINGGPVKISSNVNIVAAERVIYKVNNVNTSFSELMAFPNGQVDKVYWLPWYNSKALDTELRIANTTNVAGSVSISIDGVPVNGSPFPLAGGGTLRKNFPGVNAGPVKIDSTVNIVAAEREIYKANGINTSFTEMMALPQKQLDKVYWFPWYNNIGLDTQLRLANVTGTDATVHIYIGGAQMGTGISLPAGESTRLNFDANDGPVQIVSNQNIVVAERLLYSANGIPTSFSEMMGLPNGQLDTIYWLPWYNNLGLDTQLRFAVP